MVCLEESVFVCAERKKINNHVMPFPQNDMEWRLVLRQTKGRRRKDE
jgi:hypothetical protein